MDMVVRAEGKNDGAMLRWDARGFWHQEHRAYTTRPGWARVDGSASPPLDGRAGLTLRAAAVALFGLRCVAVLTAALAILGT